MVNKDSDIYAESYYSVKIGQGIYTSELPSNIPDGFSAKAYNLVATGDSLENRAGIRQSSVDWHAVGGWRINDDECLFARGGDSAALVWSSYVGGNSKLHLIRSEGVAGGGDGYMEITMPAQIRGVASYGGTVYFTMDHAFRIFKITVFDWVADSITYVSIPSAVGIPVSTGLFTFKDRMWTLFQNKVYYTDVAALGGGPETWTATNYFPLDANKGYADVKKLVPLANKLLIFTSAGVFSLLVEGEPSSWILKVLDSESISTSRNCAFEAKGIVYYVNTQGVWATNGQSVAKISGVIEDQFFLAKGTRFHTLHSYEDGMVLVIAKVRSGGGRYYDAPNCRILYSKLDPVGWTEWNFDNSDGSTNAFGDNRLVDIHSISPKIPTHLNSEPTVYFLGSVSDGSEAVQQDNRTQLLIFDGGENQARNRAGDLITAPMNCVLKTKYMDGGNPYRNKTLKQGLIELYTSDSQHRFNSSWDIDSTVGSSTTVEDIGIQGFTVGQASNLIRLPAGFKFRRCALTFSSLLQTNTSQIKIKDVALVLAVDRDEVEIIR